MENDKTFELMSKMYSELTSKMDNMHSELTSRMDNMTLRMDKMTSEMHEMNTRLSNVETDVKGLKADTAKNSILLEKVGSNVKLLAEGQESFRNQIGRNDSEDKRSVNDRLDVIELAATSTSRSVSDINDTVDVLKSTAANNDMDIKILKKQRKSAI